MTSVGVVQGSGTIRLERRGDLMMIGIDRPAKRNAFSGAMVEELSAAFTAFETEASPRVAVLHACGDDFTAGLDLAELMPWLAAGRHLARPGDVDPFGLVPPLRTKPVVAAMRGLCFTLAIELMLAADVVVAASDCRFGQIEVRRGIMANHGATIRMVERAGWGNAMRYLLTGDEFDAETALRLGLVQEVAPPGEDILRAVAIAERIAAQAPLAVKATILSARMAIAEGPVAAARELGPLQRELVATEDAREGLESFKARRAARFVGR